MGAKKEHAPGRCVQYLPTGQIRVTEARQETDRYEQRLLTDSVALYGVLQPLSFRVTDRGWELLDGHRRLRAAKAAGMERIPCLVTDAAAEELEQKLQRTDLHYLEQARCLSAFLTRRRLSQQEAAALLHLSQSAVANKLRLLKHPPAVLEALQDVGLSERHARALLLAPEEDREALVFLAAREGWSVARLERHLSGKSRSVSAHLEQILHRLGITGLRQETETEVIFTIRLPKMA